MNCEEIRDLLYFYINKELNAPLEEYISMHLEECEECNTQYNEILEEIKINKNIENLSAYIDNELTDKENIQIKKNIISNSNIRDEYEKLLSLKQLIKNSMSKKEFLVKDDFSKSVFKKLNLADEIYGKSLFPQILGIFIVIFIGLFLATVALFSI